MSPLQDVVDTYREAAHHAGDWCEEGELHGGDPVTRGFDSYTHIVSHKMGGEGEHVKCECY